MSDRVEKNSLVLGDGCSLIQPLMTGILISWVYNLIMGPYKPLRTWVDEFPIPYYMEMSWELIDSTRSHTWEVLDLGSLVSEREQFGAMSKPRFQSAHLGIDVLNPYRLLHGHLNMIQNYDINIYHRIQHLSWHNNLQASWQLSIIGFITLPEDFQNLIRGVRNHPLWTMDFLVFLLMGSPRKSGETHRETSCFVGCNKGALQWLRTVSMFPSFSSTK